MFVFFQLLHKIELNTHEYMFKLFYFTLFRWGIKLIGSASCYIFVFMNNATKKQQRYAKNSSLED